MWIQLQEVRDHGNALEIKRDFVNRDLELDPGVGKLGSPAQVSLRVSLGDERVRVVGGLTTVLQLVCCRCLKHFEQSVDKKLDLQYQPDPDVDDGDEFELEYSELGIGFYREDRIDLTSLVLEQLVLEIPMKPICREECKGLCSQCGADLNDTSCSCTNEDVDPRLAVLSDLKSRLT